MQNSYIKLTIEFDGTDFSGWQVQPGQRTVQGEIEHAIETITGQPIRITGAGRTDAGVHALAMVASFPYEGTLPIAAFQKGLNRHLPRDIYIHDAERLDYHFDARRHATRRQYRYVLSKTPVAVGRQYAWFPKQTMDLALMQQAADCLLGEHHFESFAKDDKEVEDYRSNVYLAQWLDVGDQVYFHIEAIRFFHNMIRILMGTMLRVGAGKLSVCDFKSILDARDPAMSGPTIPPTGLFLVSISYE